MKYLKKFNETNESFKHIVLGSLMLLGSLSKIYAQDDYQYLANCMKKQESKPSLYIENKIDSLRKYISNEIDNSNYKYKKELKDSINNIPIFSVDLSKLKSGNGTAQGCQVLFNNKDMNGNVIFIDNKINNEIIAQTILHELYHFITNYEKINYNYYIDNLALTNNNVLLNKISLIFAGKMYAQLSNKTGIDNLYTFFSSEKNYLTNKDETVVRILGMKNWLISEDRIKKMSDELNENDLQYIISNIPKLNKYTNRDFIEILPFLDYKKLFNIK